MNNKKICAVIVTYNRKTYLLKLLNALFEQTYKLDAILIFDNFSNDGTDKELLQYGYCTKIEENKLNSLEYRSHKIFYYRNNENTGGSGGFNAAIKIAFDMNSFDYLWCMDDDVLPQHDCLNKLAEHMSNDVELCIPNRTGNGFQDYAITNVDLKGIFYKNIDGYKKKEYPENIKHCSIEVKDMAFEGPLISTKLVKKIGLPNKDLFILFDDSEYAARAIRHTKILFIKDAVLLKQIIPGSNGKLPRWKIYYNFRNATWFIKNYGQTFFARTIRPLFLCFYWGIKYAVKGNIKFSKTVFDAYIDGINNKLGKNIDPSTYK